MLYNENPFKVLQVSPSAGKRKIVQQAEEESLLIDPVKCSDARTILTNPQKRIAAEVHWFLDCNDTEIQEIEWYISDALGGRDTRGYSWEQYCALTQLNIHLACLEAINFNDPTIAKYYVLGVSRLFEAVDSSEVLDLLNQSRKVSGFPEVTRIQDIEYALLEMRSEIRRLLSQRLQNLPEQVYVQILTLLSESYSGNERYLGHAVLEDAISEYQLHISDTLHQNGRAILETAKYIGLNVKSIHVEQAVTDLLESLFAWDKLAQPLQLGALTKGSSHTESVDLLESLRDLALKLHNDYGLSAQSLAIISALQEVFKELPEYVELLHSDNDALTKLIEEKRENAFLSPVLDAIHLAYEKFVSCAENQRDLKLYELIRQIKDGTIQLKNQCSDPDLLNKLYTSIGTAVHSYSLDLHNNHQRTEDALRFVSGVANLFSDVPEVSNLLQEGIAALNGLVEKQKTAIIIRKHFEEIEGYVNGISMTFGNARNEMISTLILRMAQVDMIITEITIDDAELQNQVRERLAYLVRSAGIDLHNKHNDIESTLRISVAVLNRFSDLPKVASQMKSDIATLRNLKEQRDAEKRKNFRIGALVAVACIVLGIAAYSSGGSSSSASNTSQSASPKSSTYSPYSSVSPKPTPTTTSQPMPKNGTVFYCSTTNRPSEFKVTNHGSLNYYIKFVRAGTNSKVIIFFVRAYGTVEINMPAENLELRYAAGTTWHGERELFGKDTRFAKDEESYDFENYSWEISFSSSTSDGQTMTVETIDASEF